MNYTAADAFREAGVKNTTPFENIKLPFKLKRHQILGLNESLRKKRSGLFFEARTGKSIVFQLVALYLAEYGVKTVITMPPILFKQFEESLEEIEGYWPTRHYLKQGPAAREKLFTKWYEEDSWPDIMVMSMQIFKKVGWRLAKAGYGALTIDESHMGLMSTKSDLFDKATEFAKGNGHGGNRLILSTGTPVPSGLEGAYPAINLLNPEAYSNENHFWRCHVITRKIKVQTRRGTVLRNIPDRYCGVDIVHENLYKNATRATKLEVLAIDKPNIQVVPVELHSWHQTLYKTVMRQRVLEFEGRMISALHQQKLRQLALQIISSPENFHENPKANAVHEMVEQLMSTAGVDNGEKIVVFANYNVSVEGLARKLEKYNPAVIYGPNGPSKNEKNRDKFKTDPTCRVAIINPQSGGVGLKLGDVCTTTIFAEPVSSPGLFDQAMSRVILEGQGKPVVCYILRIEQTISPKAIERMMKLGAVIKEVNKDVNTMLDELMIS